MKERSFHDRIHTIGRLTVICALVSFMAVPFVLAMVNHIPMNIPQILQNAFPILLTFSISGICENLSFMPIIGSGALYMACVTGNVSNMKVPAAVNAMEALIGALLFPYILKAPKQAIVPIILPVILIFVVGRSFFSSNQSYIMVGVIVLSALYSYGLFKKKIIG